jgi:hypothetical protein
VVWSNTGDESAWHWAELGGDGKWYPPSKLNEQQIDCVAGDAVISVTCE